MEETREQKPMHHFGHRCDITTLEEAASGFGNTAENCDLSATNLQSLPRLIY
jgi:hypothetical protein